MAASSSSVATNSIVTISATLSPKGPLLPSSHGLGLPLMSKMGKVKCSMEVKRSTAVVEVEDSSSKLGMNASLIAAAAAACAAAAGTSPAAMALVDERMSTEGTGLPFGLSNNLLGWILLGVFGLIWALYTVYTGSLDEDEESGLSL